LKRRCTSLREAARLCFRSGCNKEALFVPFFLAPLVAQGIGDIDRLYHYQHALSARHVEAWTPDLPASTFGPQADGAQSLT
jgi:hypothetical protein